jgi:hypothetical protein
MKLAILLLPFLLTGCFATKPVVIKPKWPDVPASLLEACPALKTAPENTTKLSEILDIVVDNYKQYHNCRGKVDDWIEWYNTQKKIQDKL